MKDNLKEVSIEGLELIGKGSCGTVYRLDEDKIIKVFNEDFYTDLIELEDSNAKKSFFAGVNTAISYGIVKVGNCFAIIYEAINGDTVRQVVEREPEKKEYLISEYAKLGRQMHETCAKDMGIPRSESLWFGPDSIDKVNKYLDEEEKKQLKQFLLDIPNKDSFVHGDYHIGNLLYADNRVVLIDMTTISVGHPIYDFAGIYLTGLIPELYKTVLPGTFPDSFLDNARNTWDIFLREYFKDKTKEERDRIELEIRPYSLIRLLQISTNKLLNAHPDAIYIKAKELLMDILQDDNWPKLSF